MVGSHLISPPMILTFSIPAAGTLHERGIIACFSPNIVLFACFLPPHRLSLDHFLSTLVLLSSNVHTH